MSGDNRACRNSLKESIEIDEFLELEQMALAQEKLDDRLIYEQHSTENYVEEVEMENLENKLFIPAPPPLDFSSDEEHDDLTIPEEAFPR